ncbi:uncharacterized protein LOC110688094 [Chenopodium quinoa]|nr:uncharacterized protein LOC110688094 [Chenopodium quinoa]XP_021720466.1 uncharacterized protein LOC110688094 [Chenopodium quinoa]XP_021720467.1 uncharacterized protein LOC110688094 [Chenopodium quinoa]
MVDLEELHPVLSMPEILHGKLVEMARKRSSSCTCVAKELAERIDAVRDLDFPLEYRLQFIGDLYHYHHFYLSIREQNVRRNLTNIAAMKIKYKYLNKNAESVKRLLLKQARDVESLKMFKEVGSALLEYSFPYLLLAVPREGIEGVEELEVRHFGDYLVGKLLVEGMEWTGRMILLAGKDEGVRRDILDQARADGLFYKFVSDTVNAAESEESDTVNAAESEEESEESEESDAENESKGEGKPFVWEAPSDEEP